MYVLRDSSDSIIYAATDPRRFWREVARRFADCIGCKTDFVKPVARKES